jgi:hypothetical protein
MPELTEALALSALMAGTLNYAILIRHREERRQDDQLLTEVQNAGHAALYRARLLDPQRGVRRWSTAGTRFR